MPPADTRMMGIVHSALRRDLVRVGLVLGTSQAAEPARRTALAEHLLWMMQFLHDHHAGEDDGLYPLVGRYRRKQTKLWHGTQAGEVPSLPVEAATAWAQ
jgi:hypothetical protein